MLKIAVLAHDQWAFGQIYKALIKYSRHQIDLLDWNKNWKNLDDYDIIHVPTIQAYQTIIQKYPSISHKTCCSIHGKAELWNYDPNTQKRVNITPEILDTNILPKGIIQSSKVCCVNKELVRLINNQTSIKAYYTPCGIDPEIFTTKTQTAFTLEYQEKRNNFTSEQLITLLINFVKEHDIKQVYDFGAGIGGYIAALDKFCRVEGYDATPGISTLNPLIQEQDITEKGFVRGKNKGLVLCLEVLEHIDPRNEKNVLDNIIELVDKYLILSWAKKQQGGHGHINEQNSDYIIPLIENHGFEHLKDLSLEWRKKAGKDLWWFKETIYIFKKIKKIQKLTVLCPIAKDHLEKVKHYHKYDVKRWDLVLELEKKLPDIKFLFLDEHVPNERIVDFYKQGDIIICLSHSEGNPLGIMECAAMGVLPITTNVGIVPEVFTNDYDAIIIDEPIVDTCIQKIQELNANRDKLLLMQQNTQNTILEHRTWDKLIKFWDIFHEDCIKMTWQEDQKWELDWHGKFVDEYFEQSKQLDYAEKMGLKVLKDHKGPYIDCQDKTILDMGGGPTSLLLKARNLKKGVVVDPLPMPNWVIERYKHVGIEFMNIRGEDVPLDIIYDEVWIYNVFQHTENPGLIINNIRKIAKSIRVFDWLEIGVAPGHPQNLTQEKMDNWFKSKGQVEKASRGFKYFGVFRGKAGPKVAICIPTTDKRKRYYEELLRYIKGQTYDNIEVVTVNNVTPVGKARHDVIVKALELDPDIICMLSDDDLILSTYVEKIVNCLSQDEVDWCFTWGRLFGSRVGHIHGKIEPYEELLIANNHRPSWISAKASVFRSFNYNPGINTVEDWDLWKRLDEAGCRGAVIEEELYLRRWHDEALSITKFAIQPDIKCLRFHLLGLVHLPTSKLYNACAFTQKNIKLSKMMLSLGHEVYLYGCKSRIGPQPECTEFIETHSIEDILKDYGTGDNRFEIGYDWMVGGFRHDINSAPKPSTVKFRSNCINAINARKKSDDILLITQGYYHKPIGDAAGLKLTCEPGIGYRGSYCEYRAFESAYIQNFTYGGENPKESIDGKYLDRVIPNYFDPDDVEFSPTADDYYLYIGRMITRKGVQTAVKACDVLGARLLLVGQGGKVLPDGSFVGEDFSMNPGCWEYVGYADFESRKRIFAGAIATFVPTIYLEPFAGTHVESMLSGTPVITTDFGVFPGTVVNGVNGFRCHMLQDFVDAAIDCRKLDRFKVRDSAEQFLCDNVTLLYNKWFNELHNLYESCVDSNKLAWHRLRSANLE